MKKNKLFAIGIFAGGMVFGVVLLGVGYSQRGLIYKVKDKLEAYRVAHIPKKSKGLVINDFERPEDVEGIRHSSSEIELSSDHVSSNKHNAKVTFNPAKKESGIVFKKIFEKNNAFRNWEGYDSLAFDIFNPQDESIRIKFKLKDSSQSSYNSELYLRPQQNNTVFISISQLRGKLKPSSISQMNLFFWNSSKTQVVYLDNMRLVPQRDFKGDVLVILDKQYLPQSGEQLYKAGLYHNFAEKKGKWQADGITRVPLYVNNPSAGLRADFPVSGGIPFPKGELTSLDGIELVDRAGNKLPAQFRPLGFWIDKSIKWLQVDTKMDLWANQRQICYLRYGLLDGKAKKESTSPIDVVEKKDGIIVSTGPMKFMIHKKSFRLLDEVWIDQNRDGDFSEKELVSTGSDLVIEHDGQEYRSSLDPQYTLTVEEFGPVKITIKAEGWFISKKKKQFCKFVVRLQAFAGESFVRVYHTFIYTGYPENKEHYLYKGKRLPKNETIEAVYMETPLLLDGPIQYTLAGDNGLLDSHVLVRDLNIQQDSSESFTVKANGQESLKGVHLEGGLDISGQNHGVTFVVKDLWQQYPKGWFVDPRKNIVKTSLWPDWAGALDLKTTAAANGPEAVARGSAFGLGKTHELALYFHPKTVSNGQHLAVSRLLGKTLLLSAGPLWISDTVALGKIKSYDQRLKLAEQSVDMMFDWAQRQINTSKWYGMIDYGDTISAYDDGWHRAGRHGWMNNEAMGLHSGALIQYLRTGKYAYFLLGEASARHIMDIDTVHYNTVANDRRLKKKIPDDYSQVGSQHRHNADHWGGRNEETSHTNLHGILLYYYMTGYERAFDVAKEIGEFFLQERMTYFRHPDICPQRNVANVLWGTIEMYEATGDIRYKKVADKWADVLFKGQKRDGTWSEQYNPQTQNWEGKEHVLYTTNYTLPALVAYHRITGNKAIAATLVNVVRYYMDHRPYNPFNESLLYSYFLTGENEFLKAAQERLDYFMKAQRKNDDPLQKGMIYQKPYYVRPIEFLYQLPYGITALEQINQFQGVSK